MREQFFGTTFWMSLGGLAAAFIASFFAYQFELGLPMLALVLLMTATLAAKHPTLGLFAVFLELFSNPHGHLFFYDGWTMPVSLRMAIFTGFFIGWSAYFLRTKTTPRFAAQSFLPLTILALAILIGFFTGLASQPFLDVFKDGNAYFYLLYALPILTTSWTSQHKHHLLQILAAGAVWNALMTLGILYLFTHFDETLLRSSYVFLRDIRLAEITNLGNGVYRVFIQSQFFTFVFGALLLAFSAYNTNRRIVTSLVALGSVLAVLLLSFSRSFWIGTVIATVVLLILLIRARLGGHAWKLLASTTLLSGVFAVLLILAVALFPLPTQRIGGGDLADALRRRSTSDVAVSSRWELLDPMWNAIEEQPLFGNGFGTRVSFVTDDLRVRELRPDGVWSTYAMEWGWLELWLKMGILGPIGFLILFAALFKSFLLTQKTDHAWVGSGLMAGLTFLFVIHAFSPYLNHPIGLGFILFCFCFLTDGTVGLRQEADPVDVRTRRETPVPASAVSLRVEER